MTISEKSSPSVLSNISKITIDNADSVLSKLLQLEYDEIDLSNIDYCDSAGIAALLETKIIFSNKKRCVIFLNPSKQLVDLANFLKVSKLLFV